MLKVVKKGGLPVVLAGGQQGPGALAQDVANLYWITGGSRAVLRLAKSAAPTYATGRLGGVTGTL